MTMSAQTLITNLHTQRGEIGKDWSTESLNTRIGWLNKLIAQLEQYDAEELKIRSNEHLNSAGKMSAIRELGAKLLSTVDWLKNLARTHEGEDNGFRTRLYAVKSPIKDNDIRRELRNGEIRGFLLGQNQAERDTQFLLAADHDRDEVLDAMLDSPMGPMVSEEIKPRALDARAKRQQPNDYAAFEQNTLLLEYVHMLQELIGRRLYGIGVDAAKIKDVLGVTVAREEEVRRPPVTPEQYVGASK
jgi:hypothetical protein